MRIEDINGLFKEHHKEVGTGELGVNIPALEAAEKAGILRTCVARDGKTVVGYDVFIISPDMFRQATAATEVGMYLRPEYRGRHGAEFIKWVDSNLPVDIIYRGTPVRRDFGPVLERLGYTKRTTIYGKEKSGSYPGNRSDVERVDLGI